MVAPGPTLPAPEASARAGWASGGQDPQRPPFCTVPGNSAAPRAPRAAPATSLAPATAFRYLPHSSFPNDSKTRGSRVGGGGTASKWGSSQDQTRAGLRTGPFPPRAFRPCSLGALGGGGGGKCLSKLGVTESSDISFFLNSVFFFLFFKRRNKQKNKKKLASQQM